MKSARSAKTNQVEEVQLMRASEIVVSLLGAFGQSLKETRLTAWLGYLLSLKPEWLAPLFGFKGNVLEISLENYHEDGRSDILVKTSQGLGVIEAKVDATDASAQLKRYQARWRALLTLIWLKNVKRAVGLLSESFHFPVGFTANGSESETGTL